ncbi:hypothetical protein [Bradyrhizobium sp. BR 10289]|uniref:hypothetical protein n=1 Tax=Bradyrhizobium sp. BR 10289 TaxID=2749993 RepID=UPI001C6511FE|nr:hypothetical protein [Bradyrhizobium sp. BR 10289]MBW7970944.1 hypothetical protein [Bradyrhizobium sp. BR 10289]
MPIEHLRNLAKFGVITDVDAFDLAPEAFSFGVNVRFRNGKITSAPVFRSVAALGTVSPRFVFASNPSTGLDLLFVGYLNGTVYRVTGSIENTYTVAGYTPSSVEASWSSTTLATVTYVNRSDRSPWYFRSSDPQFQDLSLSGWDSTWRCGLLRTCAGALVALNVTKGATNYPTMVKTSSIPTAGTVPASWDITNPASLAVENILADMAGGITDACPLGNDLIIYGFKQAYHMYANGLTSVYTFDPLPFKKGALNANCSVEIGGKNVVFGPDDIWQHDGTSEKSICDERVRTFIFDSLNLSKANRCFVCHNPKLKEITFAYVSGDGYLSFDGADGCNRQAVWNYANDTWSFDDLPFVYSAAESNLSNAMTYATVTATYDQFGGSYQDQEDGYKRTICYVGEANSAHNLITSLYAFDVYGQGSAAAYPVDANATKPRYLERRGIDLDELNADLRGYKTLSSVYPQVRLGSGAANLMIDVGVSDTFNSNNPNWTGYQPYDGADLYKLDYNAAGRWLAIRMKFSDYKELTILGFDLDLKITSKGPQGK